MSKDFKSIADFICSEIREQQQGSEKIARHRNILAEAMAEIKTINDQDENKALTKIINGCIEELAT